MCYQLSLQVWLKTPTVYSSVRPMALALSSAPVAPARLNGKQAAFGVVMSSFTVWPTMPHNEPIACGFSFVWCVAQFLKLSYIRPYLGQKIKNPTI